MRENATAALSNKHGPVERVRGAPVPEFVRVPETVACWKASVRGNVPCLGSSAYHVMTEVSVLCATAHVSGVRKLLYESFAASLRTNHS